MAAKRRRISPLAACVAQRPAFARKRPAASSAAHIAVISISVAYHARAPQASVTRVLLLLLIISSLRSKIASRPVHAKFAPTSRHRRHHHDTFSACFKLVGISGENASLASRPARRLQRNMHRKAPSWHFMAAKYSAAERVAHGMHRRRP